MGAALLQRLGARNENPYTRPEFTLKQLMINPIHCLEMFVIWYRMSSINRTDLDISFAITHRFHPTTFQPGFEIMISGPSATMVLDRTVERPPDCRPILQPSFNPHVLPSETVRPFV